MRLLLRGLHSPHTKLMSPAALLIPGLLVGSQQIPDPSSVGALGPRGRSFRPQPAPTLCLLPSGPRVVFSGKMGFTISSPKITETRSFNMQMGKLRPRAGRGSDILPSQGPGELPGPRPCPQLSLLAPWHGPHPHLGPSGPSTAPVSPHDLAGLSLKHRTPPSAAWLLQGSARLAPTARPELEPWGGATQSLSTQSPLRVDPASPACCSHLGPLTGRLWGGRWTVPVGQLVNNARSTGLREVLGCIWAAVPS